MIAQNLPMEREPVIQYLKQKLDSKKVQNLAEKIQVNALEHIREEIQGGLLESAETITNLILSRLIVDIAHSLVAYI
jgi:hypothetical protein